MTIRVPWLPPLPEHWNVDRLRWHSRLRKERNGIAERKMLSVSGYRGVVAKDYDDERKQLTPQEKADYLVVRPGELAINTMWLNFCGLGVSDLEGVISPAYRVYSLSSSLHPRYIHHLMRSDGYVQEYTRLAYGIRPNSLQVSDYDFGRLLIPIPPIDEQRLIADFLDRETSRIDDLVARNEQLLQLAEEHYNAELHLAATGKTGPYQVYQDGDCPWFGELPTHWRTMELRRLIKPGTSITYGIVQAGPDVDGGIPYVRTSDMAGEELPREGYLRTTPEIDRSYRRSKVQAGDLVVAIRATVGKVLPVPDYLDGANLTQGTAKISPGPLIRADYLLSVLRSRGAQQRFDSLAKGATFREITLDMLRRFKVPVPPIDEQRRIEDFIRDFAKRNARIKSVIESGTKSLLEYRAAIISAAVTGQFDVRNYRPQEAAAACL